MFVEATSDDCNATAILASASLLRLAFVAWQLWDGRVAVVHAA